MAHRQSGRTAWPVWSIGSRGIVGLSAALRTIVVARLVGPEVFGVFALAAAALALADAASDPAVAEAIQVTKDEPTPKQLRALWTISAARGALVTALLILAAPSISLLLNAQALTTPLRVLALVPMLRGLMSFSPALQARSLDIRPTLRISASSALVSLGVSIVLAARFGTASAVALGALSEPFAASLLSYLSRSPFKAGFGMGFRGIRVFLRYSRWRFFSRLATYFSLAADDIVVGRLAGAAALGPYRVAYRAATVGVAQIGHGLQTFAIPKMATDLREERSSGFVTDYAHVTVGASLAVAALMAAVADPLVAALLGPGWDLAVPLIQILATAAAIRAILGVGTAILLAAGHPRAEMGMQAARAMLLAPALLLVVPLGAQGAAWATVLSSLLALPYLRWRLDRLGLACQLGGSFLLRHVPTAAIVWVAARLGVALGASHTVSLVLGLSAGSLAAGIVVTVVDREQLARLRRL